MNMSLPVPEWHRMAMEDGAPPVRIMLKGESMFPLVRRKKDYVTIVPLKEVPVVGDIVLFALPDIEKYVVHRVWEVKNDMVLTWGDNCRKPDEWLPLDAVWGKTILIERGRKKIKPDPQKGILWAKFWHHAGRVVYPLYNRIKGIARRITGK